jgi:hypothetical protein
VLWFQDAPDHQLAAMGCYPTATLFLKPEQTIERLLLGFLSHVEIDISIKKRWFVYAEPSLRIIPNPHRRR